MEREFVPYEIALALKDLGFDDLCIGYYLKNDNDLYLGEGTFIVTRYHRENKMSYSLNNSNFLYGMNKPSHLYNLTTSPTFSQAFRFLRDKYNIYHVIKPVIGSKNGYDSFPILGWDYDIFITNKETKNSYYMGYPIGEWFTATLDRFDEDETLEDLNVCPLTYEEVELECLKKLIEIINKK